MEYKNEYENIIAWQTVLVLLYQGQFPNKLHYKINAERKAVLAFLEIIKHKNYIDQLSDLNEKFKISINKCECGWDSYPINYDSNGRCVNCGLKIK